jgi:hypothetical protein
MKAPTITITLHLNQPGYLSDREAIRIGKQAIRSSAVAHIIITEIDSGRIIFEAGRAPEK